MDLRPISAHLCVLVLVFSGCGSDPDPDEDVGVEDSGPDATLESDAAGDMGGSDADSEDMDPVDAMPDEDMEPEDMEAEDMEPDFSEAMDMADPCAMQLPSIDALSLEPAAPGAGQDVTATVTTSCFATPLEQIALFTFMPRTELALETMPQGEVVMITIPAAAWEALDPGVYELGASVTGAEETLTEDRLTTLTVGEP